MKAESVCVRHWAACPVLFTGFGVGRSAFAAICLFSISAFQFFSVSPAAAANPTLSLYCDLDNQVFATSPTDARQPSIAFTQNNDIVVNLYLVHPDPTSSGSARTFTYDPLSGDGGVTVSVALADPSNKTNVTLAIQNTWTTITNGFTGTFHTTTTELATFLLGKPARNAVLQVQITDGGNNVLTHFQAPVVVRANAVSGITPITLSLTDPGADRIVFWDDSANAYAFLSLGTGLSITGTTINASSSGSGLTGGTSGNVITASGATTIQDSGTALTSLQTKTGTLALGSFGSITGRVGNSNLPLGAQLYDTAGTPVKAVDSDSRYLIDNEGAVALTWGEPGALQTDAQIQAASFSGDGSTLTSLYGLTLAANQSVRRDSGNSAYEAFRAQEYDSGLGLVKPAVAVVATSNLTLSGEQTIDGITTSSSLVLCTAQSTGANNGPWISASGAWTRPAWYATGSTTQAPQFLTTFVRLGTTYSGSTWRMTTSGVTIGTTAQTWVQTPISLASSNVTGTLPVANGGTGIAALGTGVATWWATPSSANLRAALTDENGTGAALFDGNTSAAFTTPKITTGINDANGNEFFILTATSSAVNEMTFANAATGNFPTWTASGGDSNIGENHVMKGTGSFTVKAGTTSGNSQAWKNSSGTVVASMGQDGSFTATSSTINGGGNALNVTGNVSASAFGVYPNFSFGYPSATKAAFGSTAQLIWTQSADYTTTADSGLARNAAGVLEVNNGTAGTYRDMKVRSVIHNGYTISTLPTGVAGMTAYITDGDASLAWGATAVNSGAGATKYLVWYNGSNWTVMGK